MILVALGVGPIVLLGFGPEPHDDLAVIRIENIVPSRVTPRVRVANDRPDALDVWFVAVGSDDLQHLGSVPGLATETFAVPMTVRVMRIVVQPQGINGKPYVTGDITVDLQTDVSVTVAIDLDRTKVLVSTLDVVGQSERHTGWSNRAAGHGRDPREPN